MPDYPQTPDGRYLVAKGRLWRRTDPSLPEEVRADAVRDLMAARRAVRQAATEAETRAARDRVQAAKVRLGERGAVWWRDGAEDVTRRAPWNTGYAEWWNSLPEEVRAKGL
jgi:hypothetical protein